ncbi:MAG: hypothetical protein HYV42_03285 [Candidatus Magasanikbacteria bacterium]|nr:hypothetical protein [Candidatus Magasanikbacteria bacterium]
MRLAPLRRELVLALAAGLLTAVGIFFWLQQNRRGQELVPVLIAARDLSAWAVVRDEDIKIVILPRYALPAGFVARREEVQGRPLVRFKVAGEVLLARDVSRFGDPESDAARVPAGSVGVGVPAAWFVSGLPKLRPGDWLTIYAAGNAGRSSTVGSEVLLSALPVLTVTADRQGTTGSALLALTPAAARRLLQARSLSLPLLAAVESAALTATFTTSTP